MARLYLNAEDFICNQPFEVLAPSFYHPNMSSDTVNIAPPKRERANPFYFVNTKRINPEPFRMNVDPDLMQNCAYPIRTLIDMFTKKIEFEIVHDHDIPTIFDGLDRYLLAIRVHVEAGVEQAIADAKSVVSWRTEVYKHYFRYMKLNPRAMEELYPRNDPINNLFTLLAAIGGKNYDQFKHDPLRARMRPPYDLVDKTEPKPQDAQNGGTDSGSNIESSLGLSTYGMETLGENKFDFHEFMNGK